MEITRKVVVAPPKAPVPPIKAQQQPERKAQHEAVKPSGSQPKPKAIPGTDLDGKNDSGPDPEIHKGPPPQ
jgi:hypothetical protein